jgi:DNA replication and repair protein RecF
MLAVTGLQLSHFRSHRAVRLELDGRPVAVFGPNGAGKTNLIEAVSLLSPGRGLRGAASEELVRVPEGIGWKVAAAVAGPDGGHQVATWSEGAGRRVEVDGKAATQTALGEVVRVLWVTPAMDRLWVDAPAERRRFLDRVALSLIPAHGQEVLGYERALKERNRLIREGERDAGWFAALEGRMAEFGGRVIANREAALGRLAAVPAGAFPAAELAVAAEGGPRDAEGLAAALKDGRARDVAAGRTLTGPHRDDLSAVYAAKGTAARMCSTGEQKGLILSVMLANAKAVADGFGAPPLLLLDEVAAHLDAGRREALFAAVVGLGVQAWMTGTGAEVFDGLGERAQRVRVSEGPEGSVVAGG